MCRSFMISIQMILYREGLFFSCKSLLISIVLNAVSKCPCGLIAMFQLRWPQINKYCFKIWQCLHSSPVELNSPKFPIQHTVALNLLWCKDLCCAPSLLLSPSPFLSSFFSFFSFFSSIFFLFFLSFLFLTSC